MWGGKQLFAFIGGGAAGAAQVLSSGATIHTFTIPFKCTPIRCGFTLTAALTTSAAVVKFTGAGGTAGNCGALTFSPTAAIGKCYYENTDYVADGSGLWLASLDEGEQVLVVVTTTDVAGQGIPWLLVEINPEQPANNSAMVAG